MKTLNSRILRDVGALSRMIQTMSDVTFRGFDLQKGQFVFITRICENQGINHIRLSQLLHVDKGTTTKAVQKLIKIGYIEKRKDNADNRIHRLYPTPLALKVYDELLEKENVFISQCFIGFTPQEIEAVTNLLQRMQENMEKEWLMSRNSEKEGIQ